MAPDLSAVILAAGNSTRMGQLKQLLPWQNTSLLQCSVALAQDAGAATVIVVLGEANQQLAPLVQGQVVINQNWTQGMGTSLAAGTRAVADDHGVMVLLCDQPLIDGDDLQRLIKAWQAQPLQPAAASATDYLGVPAIFPPSCLPRLRVLDGDRGARTLLTETTVSAVAMPNALTDVDTPQDWQHLIAHYKGSL